MSLSGVQLNKITDIGLVSVLPVTYFLGLSVVTIGFFVELVRDKPRTLVLILCLATLVLMLHGTTPILFQEPRYIYVYRHIGLTRYFELHGSANRTLDIYMNWTGFFAGAAYLSKVTGLDPFRFAAWAQLFFAAADVLAVRYALRAFTTSERILGLALWIYVLTDWVGQNYFAPQALGFLLSVTAVGIVLHRLSPVTQQWKGRPDGRCRRAVRALAARAARHPGARDASQLPVRSGSGRDEVASTVLTLLVIAVVVMSHPLSPFVLTGWMIALAVLGRRRLWLVSALAIAMTAGWMLLAHTWLAQHTNFTADLGQVTSNSAGTTGAHAGSSGHRFVAYNARILSIGVWLAAAYGGWKRLRGGFRVAEIGLLAAVPFFLLLLQSYGGEAIYRVYLFSLPWCCFLVAWAILGEVHAPSIPRRAMTLAFLAVLTCLFLVAYFGLDRVNIVRPQEVAAGTWFADHAPPGSLLAVVAGNIPGGFTSNYDQFQTPGSQWGASVVGTDPRFTNKVLTASDVPGVIEYLKGYGTSNVYVVVSPSEEAYAEAFGLAPKGAVARFSQILMAQPEFQLVYRNDDVSVLRLRA